MTHPAPSVPRQALVTGANRGIGLAIARELAGCGLQVLLAVRDRNAGEAAAAAIGQGAGVVAVDLADPARLDHQIERLLAAHPDIDVLVNNAGVLVDGSLRQQSPRDLERALAVHVLGPDRLIRALAPGMIRRRYGRVVNLSSGWGAFAEGLRGPGAYAVSKAALNALTLSWAQALPETVKVNAACPGWVRTRMGGADAPRSPEEGADTPVWLATLPPDGPSGGFFRQRRRIDW